MKSRSAWLIFVMIVSVVPARADEPTGNGPTFEQLCNYDYQCKKLKNRDGSYVKPKEGLIQVLGSLRNSVVDISKDLGVDPVAVAGSIIAENSMNVQVDDDTHDFLEKVKLFPGANGISRLIRGSSFSLGFGQIKPESAMEADKLLSKMESRPLRSFEETRQALLNPIENIKYAAAIVRSCQDAYRGQGFDVSKDPAVLASLYNLGKCEELAKTSRADGRAPRMNFFGFFVNHFKDDIRKGVGLDQPTTASKTRPPAAVRIDQRLKSPVTLVGAPPKCNSSGAGQVGEYSKMESMNHSARTVLAQGAYTILSPGIDCDLKDWALIRTDRGDVGWISKVNLDLHSEPYVKSSSSGACDPKLGEPCLTKIKDQLGSDFLGLDEAGLVEVKLAGGRGKPNFKSFDLDACLSGGTDPNSLSMPGYEKFTNSDAENFMKTMNFKKAEIVSALKLKKFDDPRNPYLEIWTTVGDLKAKCVPKCSGDVQMLRTLLESRPSDYAGYQGFKKFKTQFNGLYFNTVNDPEPPPGVSARQANYEAWKSMLNDVETECAPLLPTAPTARAKLADLRRWVEEKNRDKSLSSPLGNTGGTTTDMSSFCRGVKAVKKAHAVDPSAPLSLTDKECGSCYLFVKYGEGKRYMGNSTQFSQIASFATEEKDYDDLLTTGLNGLAQMLGRGMQTPLEACSYDPMATAARIEALSSDPCVESVFAPDYYLVNKFSDRVGGAFYKPFSEDDRFAIRLKDGCGQTKSANAEGNRGETGAER